MKKFIATFSLVEQLAIIAGVACLVLGVFLFFKPAQAISSEVKQPTIPMNLDDFKDDPRLQSAIQKQLGGSADTTASPQNQPNESPQAAGASLQPTATGLQTTQQ